MFHRTLLAFCFLVALIAAPAAPAAGAQLSLRSLAATQQDVTAYTPDQIQTAYDIGPLLNRGIDGAGQTIALIEMDRFQMSDIQQFDSQSQLPDPVIQQFYSGGKAFTLGRSPETTMDIEWAHAMAPGARIQVYYIKNNQPSRAGWKALAQVLKQAAANGARAISMSFGACSPDTGYKATKNALAGLLKSGVSVFVSSGDSGALPGPRRSCGSNPGVAYPASDPSVVSVGGTSLLLDINNAITVERAWRLSGGGQGSPFSRPTWQTASTLPSDTYRWVPDVAFLGDPSTGAAAFYNGNWHQVGGTSLGAPAWAGIWALVREDGQRAGKSVGAAPPILYAIGNSPAFTQAFHDITTGGNGLYRAGPGWDAVTGWGTPDAGGLAAAVLSR